MSSSSTSKPGKVAICQITSTGDVDYNLAISKRIIENAVKEGGAEVSQLGLNVHPHRDPPFSSPMVAKKLIPKYGTLPI